MNATIHALKWIPFGNIRTLPYHSQLIGKITLSYLINPSGSGSGTFWANEGNTLCHQAISSHNIDYGQQQVQFLFHEEEFLLLASSQSGKMAKSANILCFIKNNSKDLRLRHLRAPDNLLFAQLIV